MWERKRSKKRIEIFRNNKLISKRLGRAGKISQIFQLRCRSSTGEVDDAPRKQHHRFSELGWPEEVNNPSFSLSLFPHSSFLHRFFYLSLSFSVLR